MNFIDYLNDMALLNATLSKVLSNASQNMLSIARVEFRNRDTESRDYRILVRRERRYNETGNLYEINGKSLAVIANAITEHNSVLSELNFHVTVPKQLITDNHNHSFIIEAIHIWSPDEHN